jgi:hypothetical protein
MQSIYMLFLFNNFQLKKHIVETLQTERSTIRLIIASVALGMGADLRHVKRVIHAGPPTSLESKFRYLKIVNNFKKVYFIDIYQH